MSYYIRFFEEYKGFYIDIELVEDTCYFIPFIKCKNAFIKTNINDENTNEEDKKRAIYFFKNYIRYKIPSRFSDTAMSEFEWILFEEHMYIPAYYNLL